MPSMNLFRQIPTLDFSKEKRANIELGEDQNQWSRKVLTELYRAVPEAGKYAPQVRFLRVDEEQGMALGVVVLDGTTDTAISATSSSPEAKTPNAVYIPVIVKHYVMSPLDVMFVSGGRVMALNNDRLREALFRPQPLDLLTDDWGDTSILGFFNLPGRSDIYPNSGYAPGVDSGPTMLFGPGIKTAAADFPLLSAIGPSILSADIQKLASKMETPALLEAAKGNHTFLAGLAKIATFEGNRPMENMSKAASGVKGVDVVQLSYDPLHECYILKTASRQAYFPQRVALSRGEALKFAGQEVVQKVDTEGTVTLASSTVGTTDGLDATASRWKVIEDNGIYKVKTPTGTELTGWVLTNLMGFDGIRTPISVFTNGSAAAVQEQIAGARVGSGSDLPAKKPGGTGLFYVVGAGGIDATIPVNVTGSEESVDGQTIYHVTTLTGEDHSVHVVPGVHGMLAVGEDVYVPDTVRFLPLEQEQQVQLIATPDALTKTAAYLAQTSARAYTADGATNLSFEGLPKLASFFQGEIPTDDAVFALCLAGLDPVTAHKKIAQSELYQIELRNLQDIRTLEDLENEHRSKSAAAVAEIHALRQDLTKEASQLPDAQTVDAVLSLDFINSENVRAFIAKLPYLERATNIVGHLLLASRLGLNEIPEGAAARCIRGLDEVCRGLRALGLRDLSSEAGA